jgi:hypothetical protein
MPHCEEKREVERVCEKAEEREEREECPAPPPDKKHCHEEARPPALAGLGSIFGGNIGLEELLLLGVIFLIFTDESLRDSELLICLLLILFICAGPAFPIGMPVFLSQKSYKS